MPHNFDNEVLPLMVMRTRILTIASIVGTLFAWINVVFALYNLILISVFVHRVLWAIYEKLKIANVETKNRRMDHRVHASMRLDVEKQKLNFMTTFQTIKDKLPDMRGGK